MSFDTYTAQVVAYSLFIGMWVSALLLGMIFVLYEAFKSKRPQDLLLEHDQTRSVRQRYAHSVRGQKARERHKKAG